MIQDSSMKNTKKELLDVIEKMQHEMTQKEQNLLNPEKVKKETKTKEIVKEAEEITSSILTTQIHDLKVAIAQELSDLAEKIASEAKKYTVIQEAIELKQAELEEIYGIEKHAASLAAILESNHQVKNQFEKEMALQREKLKDEISETRATWENEKKDYKDTSIEEQKSRDKKRKREEDEYIYNLQRSRSIEENNFADKSAALEKEIAEKKEKIDRHVKEKTTLLDDREQQIIQREKTMDNLEKSVHNFPDELETAINSAIEKKENELTAIFTQEKALLTKGSEGEQKVLETKNSGLESLVSDQAKQIEKLNSQQEKAYLQVQDIASKAVSGAAERPQAITVKTVERDGKN
ncbi:MAG: hypothetical protein GQ542_16610 [Desulforhopalus sp.]|nr:hypothetical protein [Desulforhopalus sp.]